MLSSFAAAALAAAAMTADPANPETAIDNAISCRSIADDMSRLACLDKAADLLASSRALQLEAAAARDQEKRDNFGFAGGKGKDYDPLTAPVAAADDAAAPDAQKNEKKEERLKNITVPVASIEVSPLDRATIVLENGQVWKQLSADNVVLRLGKKKQFTATVKQSPVAGYRMTLHELHKTIRVRRIK